MKISTIIIAASRILFGIVSYGLIDKIFERKILAEKNVTNIKNKQFEINKQMLEVQPKVHLLNGEEIIHVPSFHYNYGKNKMDIQYKFYKLENGMLVQIAIK